MKRLSKEQLKNQVYDTAIEVFKSNMDDMNKNVANAVKDVDDFSIAIVNAMAAYGAEIIKESNQILVETLYNVIYEGEEEQSE